MAVDAATNVTVPVQPQTVVPQRKDGKAPKAKGKEGQPQAQAPAGAPVAEGAVNPAVVQGIAPAAVQAVAPKNAEAACAGPAQATPTPEQGKKLYAIA